MEYTDEQAVIYPMSVDYVLSENGGYNFLRVQHSYEFKRMKDRSDWSFITYYHNNSNIVHIKITCQFNDDKIELNEYTEICKSLKNDWNVSATLFYSVPWNRDEYKTEIVSPISTCILTNDTLRYQRGKPFNLVSFEATISRDDLRPPLTMADCEMNTSSSGSAISKIFFCFVAKKSNKSNYNNPNGIMLYNRPIKFDFNEDYSWFLTTECFDVLNKLSVTQTENLLTSHPAFVNLTLIRAAFSDKFNRAYNYDDLKNMVAKWIDIFNSGDFSNESIILFLQFVYGKRNGFTRDKIAKEHFIGFIILITLLLQFEHRHLYDILYIFGKYVSECDDGDDMANQCLLDAVKKVIDPSKSDYFGYCKFIIYYFSQRNNAFNFERLLKRLLLENTKVSKIQFENEGSVATSIPLPEMSNSITNSICDTAIRLFDHQCAVNRFSYGSTGAGRYYKYLEQCDWFYLKRLYMMDPVGDDVCICNFIDSNQDMDTNNIIAESSDKGEYAFLNLLDNVGKIAAGKNPTYPDMYFEFRFSNSKYQNFLFALSWPVAYMRWPWFKLMIDIGMQESKTKSAMLPDSVTPEIMFAIACCLSNRIVSQNLSKEALKWIRSDESGIIGIKDNSGNPYPVFKQLFMLK